ncbi:MAG TPA: zinc ribbon domain-containing protein [Bryobacteraceae bacterium]|nr:zinc ribbon domain-containing protein [Bryobacteraceae bacterium]
MRAVCEACTKPQPLDWQAGDFCVHCGLAVREDVRCHWCAKWTPKGKFCRKCGAAAVAPAHYGPARMLRHMGASVFEIPKLLGELDPELIETHQAIYGSHAAVMNRHVEEARWLGGFLYQKHWAAELEEELVPQLPWPDEQLEAYRGKPTQTGSDRARAKEISETTPFARVRDLAHLARIQMGDFSALRECTHLLRYSDEAMAAEAALQFSGWRALFTVCTDIKSYELLPLLEKSPAPAHAAPRRAALGADPAPAFGRTGDADTDFLVAILEKDVRAMEGELRSPDAKRRYVAAGRLIQWGEAGEAGPALLAAEPEDQLQLLRDAARYKKPLPALRDTFFTLLETNGDSRIRRAAAQAAAMEGRHEDALRVFEASRGDSGILQTLLLAKLPPATLYELGMRLVDTGTFRADQWGMDAAAKPGGMPLPFVEDAFGRGSSGTQVELLRFAERQIEAHGLERSSLERLVIRQCFATDSMERLAAAWASIHRIQMHRQVGWTVPCDLSLDNIAWCWNMPEVLGAIAALMECPEAVRQTFVRDDFSRFLRSAEDDFYVAAMGYPHECGRVIRAAPLADPYTYAAQFAEKLAKRLDL